MKTCFEKKVVEKLSFFQNIDKNSPYIAQKDI